MRRILIPLIFGLAGAAVLISLGIWQMQRLAWKEAILSDIETRIAADPVALPAVPDPVRDRYLPVTTTGVTGPGLRVLASVKQRGAGYRMISVFETEGRKILLDRGFLDIEGHSDIGSSQTITVTGNLHWPDEVDGYTPAPDREQELWFARDVPAMAAALGTESTLLVAKRIEPQVYSATPMPVTTKGIPNDHLQYAITWFSLAAIWLAMTGYFLWRTARPPKGDAT